MCHALNPITRAKNATRLIESDCGQTESKIGILEHRSAAGLKPVSTGAQKIAICRPVWPQSDRSALTGFEAAVGLINHIGPATTADHAVIAMTVLERLEAVANLHKFLGRRANAAKIEAAPLRGRGKEVKLRAAS